MLRELQGAVRRGAPLGPHRERSAPGVLADPSDGTFGRVALKHDCLNARVQHTGAAGKLPKIDSTPKALLLLLRKATLADGVTS